MADGKVNRFMTAFRKTSVRLMESEARIQPETGAVEAPDRKLLT